MPQRIVGVDIGSWSVKAVVIESSFRGFTVEHLEEVVVDDGPPETKRERQLDALTLLLQNDMAKGDMYVGAIPGEIATTRFIELPFVDARRIDQTIGGELADAVPFDMDEAVFHHETVKKEKGTGSVSLCALAQREHVSEVIDAMHGVALDPRFLPIDVLQLFNLYTHFLAEDASKAEAPVHPSTDAATFIAPNPSGPPDGRMLVDIGHERTLICACGEDGIAFTRVIRAGGRDVTEAIARAYQIEFAHAEQGKHADGMVVSSRHPATTDAEQKMAEVVSGGFELLVKELRRTIQSIRREKRIRVARIDLLGGGSRIRNLAPYLAEQLNVPVAHAVAVEQVIETHVDRVRRGAFGVALALGLRTSGNAEVSRIDLRRGEFQFAGRLQYMRERAPFIAAAIGVLLLLMGVNVFAQYRTISNREAEIDRQFCEATKKDIGREICEPTVAISVFRQPPSELGTFQLPKRSAFQVAAEISNRAPKDLELLVEEMEITPERVRVSGATSSFDAVDQLVSAYSQDECFKEIKKGQLRKKSDGKGVDFQLSMRVRCTP